MKCPICQNPVETSIDNLKCMGCDWGTSIDTIFKHATLSHMDILLSVMEDIPEDTTGEQISQVLTLFMIEEVKRIATLWHKKEN